MESFIENVSCGLEDRDGTLEEETHLGTSSG